MNRDYVKELRSKFPNLFPNPLKLFDSKLRPAIFVTIGSQDDIKQSRSHIWLEIILPNGLYSNYTYDWRYTYNQEMSKKDLYLEISEVDFLLTLNEEQAKNYLFYKLLLHIS